MRGEGSEVIDKSEVAVSVAIKRVEKFIGFISCDCLVLAKLLIYIGPYVKWLGFIFPIESGCVPEIQRRCSVGFGYA